MKMKITAGIFLFTLVFLTTTIVCAQEDNIGVFRPSEGNWYLDYNLDGATDKTVLFGMNGDNPVVGDFDRDGTTDIGVFRSREWILDYGIDGTVNRRFNWGLSTDVPLTGDFNNDGTTDIGVFRSGEWILDYGIDGTVDRRFNYGLATDKTVVGDFNNDRTTDIGVYRSGQWILDYGMDRVVDRRFNWGLSTDKPVVGDFNNDGITDIGVFRSGQWILDYGITGTVDRRVNYGGATDIPVVGKWPAQISNQATNVEGQDLSQIPLPYQNFMDDAASVQRGLGYTADVKYASQTTTMRDYIKNRLSNDNIFFFNGHGAPRGGSILVDEDSNEWYQATGSSLAGYYNFDQISSYSLMRLVIFLGCQTGLTDPYDGNLVDVIVNKQGKCVMGWKKDLRTDFSSLYGETFWNQMVGGQTTPLYTHNRAKDAVKNYRICINMHEREPLNFTEYCNYDELYSGGPNCNTNLGSVNYLDQKYSLQISKEIEKSTMAISEELLVQKRAAIQTFTQNHALDYKLKGISNFSYSDLYEFDTDNSSSFRVNNVTGRVQSAFWDEAGSKSKKEEFTLDQSYVIAETFAKEKYPELWNISDTRGIKLARNEILDRGIDRQFVFLWEGVLYGSTSPEGQRTEIREGNAVSIIVSPYTGHVIYYNERYYPSVFAHTALVNLIPAVQEEQATRNALTEFRSLGIDVNSSGDIQSLGLRTIVDNRNDPHLAWSFKTEIVGKWGIESAYVDIDVQDGHVIWSQPFMG